MHRILAAAALGVAALLVFAAPAGAHSQLVASTPAADEAVSSLPAAFSVTMNEDLLDLAGDGTGFALQVTDAAGRFYGDGCLSIDGPTMSMGSSLGDPGAYRLVYQIVSDDGHPVSAEFTFTWAGEATGLGSPTAPVCGETVMTFAPTPEPTMPTAGPTPTSTAAPESSGTPVLPIMIGIAGVLALVAVIAVAITRQRRT